MNESIDLVSIYYWFCIFSELESLRENILKSSQSPVRLYSVPEKVAS